MGHRPITPLSSCLVPSSPKCPAAPAKNSRKNPSSLGVSHTNGYTARRLIPGRASEYNKYKYDYASCTYLSMTHPGGAGELSSTVDDMSLWDAALYTDRLVKPKSLTLAWMPNALKGGTSTHYVYCRLIEEYIGFPDILAKPPSSQRIIINIGFLGVLSGLAWDDFISSGRWI